MSTEYVIQDEIEAHEAAMRQLIGEEKEEQKAIKDADDKRKLAVRIAFMKMKKAIEAAIKAAKSRKRMQSRHLRC